MLKKLIQPTGANQVYGYQGDRSECCTLQSDQINLGVLHYHTRDFKRPLCLKSNCLGIIFTLHMKYD